MMISQDKIKSIIPHRFPMLLVDKVQELESNANFVAIKTVTCNEPCFAELGDTAKIQDYAYPCSLIIESFCQAAGIMYNQIRQHKGNIGQELMLFGSISKFLFYDEVFPGDTMEHRVRLERGLADAAVFSGEVWVNHRQIAEVERVVVALRSVEVMN
ncbi:3-hydroxyacyl-ACP dehydratase FabZ family protein [Nostoc favosum]|uniref:Beta-hydroxyacyl-ACP dehydratase n=1 Tax=Nostoc favosum CHAB5714 TaxID=2780399 RepID=A0ABS8IH84_9NOSO|nr:hypothetical protein [Nostoc favosum]MCC5603266.1 hypothetical protein [Nostoc favosum CHAB5714]